jgi:Glycosyl transferase family 2
MRIFATCIVKNEADMIAETLAAAARWCHRIFVHDTGSTDGTWELVCAAASQFPAVVPALREDVPFDDRLRGKTFELYRAEAKRGDWWGVLDADEIYIDDPGVLLAAIPRKYGVVWSSCYEFMFTERDRDEYLRSPDEFLRRPVEMRLRYYANTWSEARFWRYRRRQEWRGSPLPAGPPSPVRIRYKHYQYRSPEQIQHRLDTRWDAVQSGQFQHERREHWAPSSRRAAELLAQGYEGPPSWEERVADVPDLHYDAGDGRYVADEESLPLVAQP